MGDDRVPMKQVGVDLLIDKPTFLQRIDTHPNPLNPGDLNSTIAMMIERC